MKKMTKILLFHPLIFVSLTSPLRLSSIKMLLPFHLSDLWVFYLSLAPALQLPSPTSSISSFQTSFFSISRPLTDQYEKHQRQFIFMTSPSECYQHKCFCGICDKEPQRTTDTISIFQTLQNVHGGFGDFKGSKEAFS